MRVPTLLAATCVAFAMVSSPTQGQSTAVVKAHDTTSYPMGDPSGLCHRASTNTCFAVDSEIEETGYFQGVNVFEMTPDGTLLKTYSTLAFTSEPTGITCDEASGHFWVTDDDSRMVFEFEILTNGSLNVISSFTTGNLGIGDPEGISIDPVSRNLFIADGLTNGTGSVFEVTQAGVIVRTIASPASTLDAEGVYYEPTTKRLWIIYGANKCIVEQGLDGTIHSVVDLLPLRTQFGTILGKGIMRAPTSDPNDDPANMNLFFADYGFDEQNDGRIFEIIPEQGPLRKVMPLGDSITQARRLTPVAYANVATYRYFLWHDLLASGHCIDFVGSQTTVPAPQQVQYNDFDDDHEGMWDRSADEIAALVHGFVTAAQPDIILCHAGSVDLTRGETPASTATDIETIINEARRAKPNVTILLAQIIPFGAAYAQYNPNVGTLNTAIANIAATMTTAQSPIQLVDHFTGWDPAVHTLDGVHPFESGERRMATGWHTALSSILPSCAAVADFSLNSPNGVVPHQVFFTNKSTGFPTGWLWDFGDGETSTEKHPRHTYQAAGIYTISLTAANASGSDVKTLVDVLTVTNGGSPIAQFVGTPTSGNAPLIVNFADQSQGAPTTWLWDFGDNSTSDQQNPSHPYGNPGLYTVKLTATNAAGGNTKTRTNYIEVTTANKPTADFDATPTTGDAPHTVNFTDLSTDGPTSWEWNFGDGTTVNAQNPSHIYTTAGTYTVSLTAGNSQGTDTRTRTNLIVVGGGGQVFKIMPFGDSITEARDGWASYRYFLWNQLKLSERCVDFVGSKQGVRSGSPKYANFDQDHEGHDGFRVDELLPQAHAWVLAHQPDIILAHVGSNDLYDGQDVPSTIFEIGTLIDEFRRANPTVTILLAKIIPFGPRFPVNVVPLNDALPALVASKHTAQSPVVLVDHFTGWDVSIHSRDDVHPSEPGEIRMANTWHGALATVVPTCAPGSPDAEFVASPAAGLAPLRVAFTDQSSNSPSAWHWDFGDGSTSDQQNPNHTFGTAGMYSVKLLVTNANGTGIRTRVNYITVGSPSAPVADFSGTPRSGTTPLQVTFTDQSAGNPTSWEWRFGDGATSSAQNPVHTYLIAGTYTVELIALNGVGQDTKTRAAYIEVANPNPPTADFTGAPTSGGAPLNVVFADASGGNPTSWEWEFGDGKTSTAKDPTHEYTSPGTYSVKLTITNAGGSDAKTRTNYIDVVSGPRADFTGAPTTGIAPLAVAFNDASTGTPTSWRWDFGDGSTSNSPSPTHRYAAAGKYTVRLSVSNVIGNDAKTRIDYIEVTNPIAPTADFTGTPTSGTSPLLVTFADASTGAPTSWSWDFGDNTTANTQNPSHSYARPGNYTVQLKATNAHGGDTRTRTDYIRVHSVTGPQADFSATPTSGRAPSLVTFTDRSTNNPSSWVWEFGDGGTSTQQNPSHRYIRPGTYSVKLSVKNLAGSDTKTRSGFVTVGSYSGQGYLLSRSPGFQTDDRTFWRTDRIYMLMWSDRIDHGDMDKHYWELKDSGGKKVREDLTNHRNRSFSESFALSQLPTSKTAWWFKGKIEDDDNRKYEVYTTITVHPGSRPLVADFAGTPTAGTAPLVVKFADLSTGGPTGWDWDFGDGSTSTVQHPTHTYTAAGFYTVKLTTSNATGFDVRSRTDYISVRGGSGGPIVDFTGTPTSGAAPLEVAFRDHSTNSPTSWRWEFGDGTTATQQNPTHYYVRPGRYTVKLTANNATGSGFKSKSEYINVGKFADEGYMLSKNADFSTKDVNFTRLDTLHILLHSDVIDFDDMKHAYWELKDNDKKKIRLDLVNNRDGSFSAAFKMAQLPSREKDWTFRAKIEDDHHKYEVDKSIVVTSTSPTGGVASFVVFGSGCAGSAGTPTLLPTPGVRPIIGRTFSVELSALPASAPAIGITGLRDDNSRGLPLPFDLSRFGMPGCELYVEYRFIQFLRANQSGRLTWRTIQAPNNSALSGLRLFFQASVSDFGVNSLGTTMTNGGEAKLGVR